MKLAASYNVFSGLEWLQHSIDSIRDNVDHISVVYQTESNLGEIKPHIKNDLINVKGVDSWMEFFPTETATPKQNETRKRNIGLFNAMHCRCTHFISMDTDELYDKDQFRKAKQIIEVGDYDSSACKMQTYYHSPCYRLTPPEEYYVPFIYKIDGRRFNNGQMWPVSADPSRKMEPGRMKLFTRDELEMHHYSYVRLDIREKLNNASSSVNFKSRIEDIAMWYDTWSYPVKAYLGGSRERYYDVEKVDNKFNIEL